MPWLRKFKMWWVMPMAAICAECYPKYFPAYPEMEIEVGSEFCKCIGCGEMKEIVKRVIVAGKVVDVN